MSGYDEAVEVRNKIAGETEAKKEEQNAEISEAKASLSVVAQNDELLRMYRDNAEMGSENLAGQLPVLKIHTANKSEGNVLAEGGEPNDGWYFYKPTRTQFKEPTVHILSISRGYRALMIDKKTGKQDEKFTQLVGGMLLSEGKFYPFIMYSSGVKLQNLWDFGKTASVYTKNKTMPIPLFALVVQLGVEKVSHSFGTANVPVYTIVKSDGKNPDVVTDMAVFKYLRESVYKAEEMMQNIIESKASEQQVEEPPVREIEKTEDNMPF